ncbi:uncharacterized protein LOC134197129 isoform X2 [Corticium candelabrum]|uniref:uncharacterized protein LOC134197129 isoform X2 n=1 Tax=Corticium candelabrum TaxID=121492 RepID=UPI002E265C78|nr:uncharacterized protein LOC134197129 isoform X2 [Corticium candelabrum]
MAEDIQASPVHELEVATKQNLQLCQSDDLTSLVTKLHRDGVKLKDMKRVVEDRMEIKLSIHQIKRLCKLLGLNRKRNYAPIERAEAAVKAEKASSGENLGYRGLWKRLQVKHKLLVPRDVVMELNQKIDPEGVQLRLARKLKRRKYYNKGPNYVWHIDGYDKLKQFGFPIHGCIDGYSRRILWLQVAVTNNDPRVIAGYYTETVKNVGGCPRVLRADRGTENTNVAFIQPFLRHFDKDALAGEKSFWYGKSTSNQRIESWWGQLRKNCIQWWMNFFKDMRMSADFDDSNQLHTDALRFCFMSVIDKELQSVKAEWNAHFIRPSKYCDAPRGIPNILYYYPELKGAQCYKNNVSPEQLAALQEYIVQPPPAICQEFSALATSVMQRDGLTMPNTANEECSWIDSMTVIICLKENTWRVCASVCVCKCSNTVVVASPKRL